MALAILGTLPAGTWVTPDDFLDALRDHDPDFLFSEHSKVAAYKGQWYSSYSEHYYYGRRDDLLNAFEQGERLFVRGLLTVMLLLFLRYFMMQ